MIDSMVFRILKEKNSNHCMTILGIDNKNRCFGGQKGKELYGVYHDTVWAKPCYNDHNLFEALVLETMQSGLSFEIILKRKEALKKAFFDFDPDKCAALDDNYLESLMQNVSIIRHKKKIFSVRQNAQVYKKLQNLHGSFSKYLWSFVDHTPITRELDQFHDNLHSHPACLKLSCDLKQHGMTFVAPKTILAYMQAVGLFNDHLRTCHVKNPS